MQQLRTPVLHGSYMIRFADCDPMGHLFNGDYLRYFQNAREDHIRKFYEQDLSKIATEEQSAWVVVQNQISYLRPAVPNEEVIMSSCVFDFNDRFVDVEMVMWSADRKTIKSLLWIKFAFFDVASQRSKKHDDKYMELFRNVHFKLPQESFDERSAAARSFNRNGSAFYTYGK